MVCMDFSDRNMSSLPLSLFTFLSSTTLYVSEMHSLSINVFEPDSWQLHLIPTSSFAVKGQRTVDQFSPCSIISPLVNSLPSWRVLIHWFNTCTETGSFHLFIHMFHLLCCPTLNHTQFICTLLFFLMILL